MWILGLKGLSLWPETTHDIVWKEKGTTLPQCQSNFQFAENVKCRKFPWSWWCLCLTITESCKVKKRHLTSRFYHFVVYSIAVGTVYGHATARKNSCLLWVSIFLMYKKLPAECKIFKIEVLNLTALGIGTKSTFYWSPLLFSPPYLD